MNDQDSLLGVMGKMSPPLSGNARSLVAAFRCTRGRAKEQLLLLVKGANVALAATLLTGCHTWVPIAFRDAPVQSEVRATLTTQARLQLEDSLGLGRRSLTGRLLEKQLDSMTVLVRTTGVGTDARYQPIGIAERDVLALELKDNHNARTLGIILGAVGTLAIVSFLLIDDVKTGSPPPTPPDPTERLTGRPDRSPLPVP